MCTASHKQRKAVQWVLSTLLGAELPTRSLRRGGTTHKLPYFPSISLSKESAAESDVLCDVKLLMLLIQSSRACAKAGGDPVMASAINAFIAS